MKKGFWKIFFEWIWIICNWSGLYHWKVTYLYVFVQFVERVSSNVLAQNSGKHLTLNTIKSSTVLLGNAQFSFLMFHRNSILFLPVRCACDYLLGIKIFFHLYWRARASIYTSSAVAKFVKSKQVAMHRVMFIAFPSAGLTLLSKVLYILQS